MCIWKILIALVMLLAMLCTKAVLSKKRKDAISKHIEKLEKRAPSDDEKARRKRKNILEQLRYKCETFEKTQAVCIWFAIFICIAVICLLIVFIVGILSGGNESDIGKVNTILLSDGGKEEAFDPADEIEPENGITEKESDEERFEKVFCYSWYMESSGSVMEKKLTYTENTEQLIKEFEKQLQIEDLQNAEAEMQNIYNKKCDRLKVIEERKVPEGHELEEVESGAVAPLPLDARSYIEEYALRLICYEISPSVDMLQQMARAAEDAALTLILEDGRKEEVLVYAEYAFNNYLCLMRSDGAKESRADCCFWMAKLFAEMADWISWNRDLSNHCKLMSFAFCKKGVDYLNTLHEENHQKEKLLQLFDRMDLLTEGL